MTSLRSAPATDPPTSPAPETLAPDRPFRRVLSLSIWVALLVVAFVVLHHCYFRYARLPEQAYFRPLLLAEMLRQPKLVLTLLLPATLLFWRWNRIGWDSFDGGRRYRWFVFCAAATACWSFATYQYNHYYDQPHLISRCLLVVLTGLLLWHPAFIAPYLTLVCVIIRQFDYPIPGYNLLDKRILLDVLIMLQAFLYLSLLRRQPLSVYLGLVICLIAGNYFIPGLGKVQIEWLFEDRLFNLSVASYMNGWLRSVDPARFLAWIDAIKPFNSLLLTMTLALELGALCFLAARPAFIALVSGSVMLHAGIFVASGIFFWQWMVLDVALLVLVHSLPSEHRRFLFGRAFARLSLVLIAAVPFYGRPTWLMWYDTNLNSDYELEVVGNSGNVYPVARMWMRPYQLIFAQSRFWYLNPEKVLVGTYGATMDREVNRRLAQSPTPETVAALVEERGQSRYDETAARRFDEFIRRYFGSVNRTPRPSVFLERFRAPSHIWTHAPPGAFQGQEPVVRVLVRFRRQLYDGTRIHVLKDEIIRTIDLDAPTTES